MLSRHVILKGEYLKKLDSIQEFSSASETILDSFSPTDELENPTIRLGQEIPSYFNHLAVKTTNDHTLFFRIQNGKNDGQILVIRNANQSHPIYFANINWAYTDQPDLAKLSFNIDLGYADTPKNWQRFKYYRDSGGIYYLTPNSDNSGLDKIYVDSDHDVLNSYTESLLPGESLVFMYNLSEKFWFLVSLPFSVEGGSIA